MRIPIESSLSHRHCIVEYLESKTEKLDRLPSTVDCPSGARCQVSINVPAVNILLKNTIEENYRERIEACRQSHTQTTADLERRVESLKLKAAPNFSWACSRPARSLLTVGVCLLLAFLAGMSISPHNRPSAAVSTPPTELPRAEMRPNLFDWAQEDPGNWLLVVWSFGVLHGAPTLMDVRIRYNAFAPNISSPVLLAEHPYRECVERQTDFEFWTLKVFFPYECAIQASEMTHEIGMRWTIWLHVMNLRWRYLRRVALAVLPVRLDPLGVRHHLGVIKMTCILLVRALLESFVRELIGIVTAWMALYCAWILGVICFFVPKSVPNFCLSAFMFLSPISQMASHADRTLTYLMQPASHRNAFFAMGLVFVADCFGWVDVSIKVAVSCALVIYRILVVPIY